MAIRFTLTSTSIADDQLTDMWLQAPSALRRAITHASNVIDRELRIDAHLKGMPRPALSQSLRSLDVGPLRVYYDVLLPDRLVRIRQYEFAP